MSLQQQEKQEKQLQGLQENNKAKSNSNNNIHNSNQNRNFLENSKQAQKAMNSDSPYAEISKKVSDGVRKRFDQATSSSPLQVAEVILNAIKSENLILGI